MPTLRLAKLSHGRERQSLLPFSGSIQGGVATSESMCSRCGGCNTKSRGGVAGGRHRADELPLGAVCLFAKEGNNTNLIGTVKQYLAWSSCSINVCSLSASSG